MSYKRKYDLFIVIKSAESVFVGVSSNVVPVMLPYH